MSADQIVRMAIRKKILIEFVKIANKIHKFGAGLIRNATMLVLREPLLTPKTKVFATSAAILAKNAKIQKIIAQNAKIAKLFWTESVKLHAKKGNFPFNTSICSI